MSDERSIVAFNHWRESAVQFDYFILGVSTATFAYLAQSITRLTLGWNADTVLALSLTSILASILFGIKRAESFTMAMQLNARILHNGEVKGTLVSTLEHQDILNKCTGDVHSVEERERRIRNIDNEMKGLEPEHERAKNRALRYYRLRDWSLVIGLLAYTGSKITW